MNLAENSYAFQKAMICTILIAFSKLLSHLYMQVSVVDKVWNTGLRWF